MTHKAATQSDTILCMFLTVIFIVGFIVLVCVGGLIQIDKINNRLDHIEQRINK